MLLSKYSPTLSPPILDAGGKKVNKRGSFDLYDYFDTRDITTVNIDISTHPDIASDFLLLDSDLDNFFKSALCIEVLEHVQHYDKFIFKLSELTASSSRILISVPWLVPIHSDPFDYWRFTPSALTLLFNDSSFEIESLYCMGNIFDVCLDLLQFYLHTFKHRRYILRFWAMFKSSLDTVLPPRALKVDDIHSTNNYFISTGWFFVLRKK
ncbi:hypothetical protein SynMITS9220_00211 [Synechococcus sp. MIT S9220]|nr:hypothetical protein SynMITS9220_00211 [Synechococcus sp. MIT S9220]